MSKNEIFVMNVFNIFTPIKSILLKSLKAILYHYVLSFQYWKFDKTDIFPDYVNNDSIVYCKIEKFYWENILKELINDHIKFTNSIKAKEIVRDWANEKKNFWQVVPKEIINQLEKPVFDKKNIDLKKKLA